MTGPCLCGDPDVQVCPHCDGAGYIEVCYGNNPDAEGRETCPECKGREAEAERERDSDDGSTYADPGDELERRMLED